MLVAAPVPIIRPAAAPPVKSYPLLSRIECAAALALTILVIYLHGVFRSHAGGLWRDEANTVALATLPSFAEIWDGLQFDSFPILIFAVIRGWSGLFSSADAPLRMLGLLFGLGIFGALWLNARLLGHRWPLLALALLGCNPLFIRYADSLRAYGLGMLLMLLTFGAVWRVVEAWRPERVVTAAILAVLSVQALYYNSVLLFSMCAGGAITCAWERQWKQAIGILAIGVPAAASLSVYAGTIHRLHEWNFLVSYPVTLAWIWKKLSDVTGSPDPVGVWIWTALLVGAIGLMLWQLRHRLPGSAVGLTRPERVLLFAGATLMIGTISYVIFLEALDYYTQPWYYVAYLALAAVSLDTIYGAAILARPGQARTWRLVRLGFIWTFCALMAIQTGSYLHTRQTNVDLIASQLNRATAKGDLIVNIRWECDITFERYYHGPAQDVTLPPIADHRFHRYDLVLRQMMKRDAAQPVLDQMEQTLRAGHRVWLVGEPAIPFAGEGVPVLPPAKAGPTGFRRGGGNYYQMWAMQAADLLMRHATRAAHVRVPVPTLVTGFEDLKLSAFEGWH